jgi:GT2 family glycosyltransferase
MIPAAEEPVITLVVPSLNQGRFLDAALASIFSQEVPVEVMLADGGSTDATVDVIEKWRDHLSWWRSETDAGQAAAINEAMQLGKAPFVGWLNSDDLLLPGGLAAMVEALRSHPSAPAVYGRCRIINDKGEVTGEYRTTEFSEQQFARRCFISQPASLVRRQVWEAVDGLDTSLGMALDYDLWWRIYRQAGELLYLPEFIACTRHHDATKTASKRTQHYREAMRVVANHYGSIPLRWYLAWPCSVWGRAVARHARKYIKKLNTLVTK